MEWAHSVELTGEGAPYIGEILDAAFSNAQAVVVLFSNGSLSSSGSHASVIPVTVPDAHTFYTNNRVHTFRKVHFGDFNHGLRNH